VFVCILRTTFYNQFKRKPFVLIHIEQFENKSVALKRELFLKTLKGGSELISFLKSKNILDENNKLKI